MYFIGEGKAGAFVARKKKLGGQLNRHSYCNNNQRAVANPPARIAIKSSQSAHFSSFPKIQTASATRSVNPNTANHGG
jgi:hypothetical protein